MITMESLKARSRLTEDGCWEWTGYVTPAGYGQVGITIPGVRRNVYYVHRVSAHLALGLDLFDSTTHASHRCDNPPCFNPDHLFLGSHRDNMVDHVVKGRHWKGRYPKVKTCIGCGIEFEPPARHRRETKYCSRECHYTLTDEDAADIFERAWLGKRGINKQLAEEYGVSDELICDIKYGRRKAAS